MLEMKVFLKKKEKCFITLDYLLKLIIKKYGNMEIFIQKIVV
jgi:hypothetical protein